MLRVHKRDGSESRTISSLSSPSTRSSTLCFDLIRVGLVFRLELEVGMGGPKEHLAVDLLAYTLVMLHVHYAYLNLIQSL